MLSDIAFFALDVQIECVLCYRWHFIQAEVFAAMSTFSFLHDSNLFQPTHVN